MRGLILARASIALLLVLAYPARAEDAKQGSPHAEAAAAGQPLELPQDIVTQHTITLDGRQFSFRATAGTLTVTGPKEISAKIFYVSYTGESAAARPVTFAFNGGPGAAAAFLHLGALGPRIVPFQANGAAPLRPVHIEDNPDSWLAFTDLVFIDPVGTGYSRTVKGGAEAEKAFWNVDKDVDSMAEAVRLWLSRNGRDLAPIYLAGESYGGFRVAELSNRLLSMGLAVQGAVMISPALDFSLLRGGDSSILPLTFALPSLTAASEELRDGPKASLASVHEAEAYARTGYLVHLAGGIDTGDDVIKALANFTGLDPAIVKKHHGRVSARLFSREYLRRTGRALSLYDATVTVPVPSPSEHPHFDPILDGAVTVLAPAAVSYIGKELGFNTSLEYRLLNREVSAQWDFGLKPGQQGYAGSLDSLEEARVHNPALRVLIAHGYTDLVTPYTVSRFLVSQYRPIEGAAPIDVRIYRGGHMMYLRPASRAELRNDARGLYKTSGEH